VTTVLITCTTGTAAIGGQVIGLSGTGLVLQDNGADDLKILVSGNFQFQTALTLGTAYNVTVKTQPGGPAQTCTVTNGNGTANVTVNNIQITCSLGTLSIGGSVSGFSGGTGFALQDNGGDTLAISKNGAFTFPTLVPVNGAYNVTVSVQPSGPNQTCTVSQGVGTATTNVTSVSVVCPAVFHPIDVNVVGLLGNAGQQVLIDEGGDNLATPKNGRYTFATPIADGTPYDVAILVNANTQPQSCYRWGWSGIALSTPVNPVPLIDCGHDDWTWMDGPNTVDQLGKVTPAPSAPVLPKPPAPGIASLSPYDGFPAVGSPADSLPVTILGQNFGATQAASTVTFNGVNAGAAISWSNNTIVIPVPSGFPVPTTTGQVVVTVAGVPSNGMTFTIPVCPPLVSDTPGGHHYSTTWTDQVGRLWLLTGEALTSTSPPISNQPGFFSELWVYTGTDNYGGGCGPNFWVFVPQPAFGRPVGRWGAVSWTDPTTGNLWLFGGQDQFQHFLNDMWEFNIASKTWTSHGGGADIPGVYSGAMRPGGRWGASGRLDVGTKTFWMFGGIGCDTSLGSCSNNLLNDLWKYDTVAGTWTFVSGSSTGNQAGTYGAGPPSAGTPGGRQGSVAWIDNSQNFWMFGGFTTGTNGFNDLWKYDTVANAWTWESGSPGALSTHGNYGIQGTAAASNVPGARWIPAAWSDTHGNLWLFGGEGYDTTGNGTLGDLWEYTLDANTDPGNPAKIAVGQWTWIRGPNSVSQPGNYGRAPDTTAVWQHVTNNPGTRWGAAYWTTTAAQTGELEFWMLGGEGFDSTGAKGLYNLLNDLWRYLPYP
jgi:hypothetical protein